MANKNSFGSILKRLREEKRKKWLERNQWTKVAVAKSIEVSRVTYDAWENDVSLPDAKNLKRIIEVFRPNEQDELALRRASMRVPPLIHNFPEVPSPNFTGRTAYLSQLEQFLEDGKELILIGGQPGIGKTEIALTYAYRAYAEKYRVIFWVDSTDMNTIQASYIALAKLLELPEDLIREAGNCMRAVHRWLETHSHWLLILDNIHDLDLTFIPLPIGPLSQVIIITSFPVAFNDPRVTGINVEPMEPEEALLLLLRCSGILPSTASLDAATPEVREEAYEIVKVIGGNPYVMLQIGTYIKQTGLSFADFMTAAERLTVLLATSGEVTMADMTVKADTDIIGSLLQEVGLGSLADNHKAIFISYMHETIGTRIIERLSESLTEEQLDEFERLANTGSNVATYTWLIVTCPNFREVMADEFTKFKATLAQTAPYILTLHERSPGEPPSLP